MSILDRQRYKDFVKAYFICFVALVGLVVVIDAFANIDEFTEVASGMNLAKRMGRYYLVRMSLFYDQLCGVIVMMAAVFAATWIQKNNELIAMLAAGIGTKRVMRPVIISACLFNLLAVANQEFILPDVADEIQKPPDDFSGRKVLAFRSRTDLRGITINGGKSGEPATQTVTAFHASLPFSLVGVLGTIDASEARYIPESASRCPLRGGWLLRGTRMNPPTLEVDPEVLVPVPPEMLAQFPKANDQESELRGSTYFLRSSVSFETITRNVRTWYRFASSRDLLSALTDPANEPEHAEIAVYLHGRIIRPLLAMALLLLTLPMVFRGPGGGMFVNMGMSLATSALFYGVLFVTQYLGGNGLVRPDMAAWIPLIGFGTLAASRWDKIHT